MPYSIKMFKGMFLQTSLTSQIFSLITFTTFQTASKQSVVLPTHYLRQILGQISCQKIYQTFVITVKAMVNFI